jgi:hypothetical protein
VGIVHERLVVDVVVVCFFFDRRKKKKRMDDGTAVVFDKMHDGCYSGEV